MQCGGVFGQGCWGIFCRDHVQNLGSHACGHFTSCMRSASSGCLDVAGCRKKKMKKLSLSEEARQQQAIRVSGDGHETGKGISQKSSRTEISESQAQSHVRGLLPIASCSELVVKWPLLLQPSQQHSSHATRIRKLDLDRLHNKPAGPEILSHDIKDTSPRL